MISGKAPEFDLPSLGGGQKSFEELVTSGPLLLVFFKVTCPTCKLTLPFLERIHRGKSPDTGLIVAISQDDVTATGEFSRRYEITLPMLLDPHEDAATRYPVSNAYGITHVPSLFLVERDGRISKSVNGFDRRELEAVAQRFGCRIFTEADRVPVYQPG